MDLVMGGCRLGRQRTPKEMVDVVRALHTVLSRPPLPRAMANKSVHFGATTYMTDIDELHGAGVACDKAGEEEMRIMPAKPGCIADKTMPASSRAMMRMRECDAAGKVKKKKKATVKK